jgi:hypothetical protein
MTDVDVADIEVADIEFYWDPICPFAWVTSRWVEKVVAQRPMTVDWRSISLRILNEGRDYETEFPPNYLDMHTRGVRMLRVAAAAREAHGREVVGPLYTELGESIWNRTRQPGVQAFAGIGDAEHLSAVLAVVGLPAALAAAADDPGFDTILRADTEAGLVGHAGVDVDVELFAALARLSAEQRTAVLLVHGHRYTYAEVSDVLGLPVTSVTNHVHRGMRRLRRLLGVHDG